MSVELEARVIKMVRLVAHDLSDVVVKTQCDEVSAVYSAFDGPIRITVRRSGAIELEVNGSMLQVNAEPS